MGRFAVLLLAHMVALVIPNDSPAIRKALHVANIQRPKAPAAEQTRKARAKTAELVTDRKMLTVERIYSDPPLTGRPAANIRWLPNSKAISYTIEEGPEGKTRTSLIIADVPSGKKKVVCLADTVRIPDDLRKDEKQTFSIGSYEWAKNGELIVFGYKGEVFTLEPKTGRVKRLTRSTEHEKSITFSPDGETIGMTRGHDLYVIDVKSGAETPLTTTGCDTILNGVLDWVYMEELFTRGNVQAYWWSPDSRKIAYLEINESPVPNFPIVDFLPVRNQVDTQRYPKAGDNNPIVRVGVHDLKNGQTTWMNVDTSDDSYIARVYWLGDSKRLAIEKLNRAQDELRLLFADVETGGVTEVLKETSDTWVNITYMKHYYEKKPLFVWSSERDGFSHLFLYNNEGQLLQQLTKGDWAVSDLDGVDEQRGDIYFTALEKSVLERHAYRVTEQGGRIERLTLRTGTHSVTYSPDFRYFFDQFSDVRTPSVVTVHDAKGKELFTVSKGAASELAAYDLPVPEFFTIDSKDGLEFQCTMIKPNAFNPNWEYPAIVYVYGGPHAQVVRNRWGGDRYLWHAMMASRGFIIFSLDNRGSYGRGAEWENVILKNMGRFELEDQLTGVEFLQSLPFVDASRIGIWGWSYGGYMTSLAMFKAPGAFRAGAAVAPVTDWHLYDTIYTERYMKRPQENADGYRESAPINFAGDLEDPFLLVHGTADDNVHLQNSVKLAKALIDANKPFELMLYPGKLHGIGGNEARTHLYKLLTRFFEENL